jgi:hypothetical protein
MNPILTALLALLIGLIPFVVLLLRRAGGESDSGVLRERLSLREQRIGELESELSQVRSRLEQESVAKTGAETG